MAKPIEKKLKKKYNNMSGCLQEMYDLRSVAIDIIINNNTGSDPGDRSLTEIFKETDMMDFFRVVLIILLAIPVGVLGKYLLEKIVDDALESKKKDGKK